MAGGRQVTLLGNPLACTCMQVRNEIFIGPKKPFTIYA